MVALNARMDHLAGETTRLQESMRMDLSGSEVNDWLKRKTHAFWETREFRENVNNLIKSNLSSFQVDSTHMNARFRASIMDIMKEDLAKEVLKAFDANLERFKRQCQQGMLKESDIPSTFNMLECKNALKLSMESDIKKRMDVLASTVSRVCDGILETLTDNVGLYESEAKLMDSIFSSNILVRFFGELSSSEKGLGHLVEDLRVWERSAPITRVETLNALILSLKTLQAPVFANQIVDLLKVGLPTSMDKLLEHLNAMAVKDLGCLSRVPLMDSKSFAPKNDSESRVSETSIEKVTPLATSSAASLDASNKDSMTRMTLERLKKKIVDASANTSK